MDSGLNLNALDQELQSKAWKQFNERFGRAPRAGGSAPGRVNLIGDHVDYCNGFVLPVALQYQTLIVGDYNGTSTCNIVTITESGQEMKATFSLPVNKDTVVLPWAKYVVGVIHYFPGKKAGFDAVIVSNVPMGGGVSSSAALEVSTFTFLQSLSCFEIEPVKKALACQKAEHEFAGMPCGIMDQFISTLGKKDCALLIDCKSLESTHIPIKTDAVKILVINSNVKHQLTGSEYPQRREQCQKAAELLGLKSLRDAKVEDLEVLSRLGADPVVIQRARHVITEIKRTEEAADSLRKGDYEKVGSLFYASHESLSSLMCVSCVELDVLVGIARRVRGVLGARMTGGGFGGCVVALVKKENLEDLKTAIRSEYQGSPTFFECIPSDGARLRSFSSM